MADARPAEPQVDRDPRSPILTQLRGMRRRIRVVRAAACAGRFLVAGLFLAAGLLLARSLIPVGALPLAAGLAGLSGLAGAAYGALAPLPLARAARMADLRLGLKERFTTASTLTGEEAASEIGKALLDDVRRRPEGVAPWRAFPLEVRAASRWLLAAAALVVAVALLPPIPIRLPTFGDQARTEARQDEPEAGRKDALLREKPPEPPRGIEGMPRSQERHLQGGRLAPRDQKGDLNAVFKDTKISQRRPDFGSFLKEGDERLRLLAQVEAIPDLSRDFTQSPYQVVIRRMQGRLRSPKLQGLSWEEIQRLLSELGERGRAEAGLGGEFPADYDVEGGGSGPRDRALDALARALSRLREKGEGGRGPKDLRQGRDRGGRPGGEGAGDEGSADAGLPGGSLPGKGRSLQTRGDPTPRIGGPKMDAGLEGEARDGIPESYETNLSGPGARNPSRLPYLDVFSHYKKMMEEALGKEPIPYDYREQVKGYFQSLEQR